MAAAPIGLIGLGRTRPLHQSHNGRYTQVCDADSSVCRIQPVVWQLLLQHYSVITYIDQKKMIQIPARCFQLVG